MAPPESPHNLYSVPKRCRQHIAVFKRDRVVVIVGQGATGLLGYCVWEIDI